MSNIIKELEQEQMKQDVPAFGPGDTVVVQVKVKEGNRERLQAFEGVVIAKRNRGLNSSFTVRKISHGEGVELQSLFVLGDEELAARPRSPCNVLSAQAPGDHGVGEDHFSGHGRFHAGRGAAHRRDRS